MSVATNRPPGFMSAITGMRAQMSSKSCRSNGTPSSRASAIRCSAPLVEPPAAETDIAAFSIALRVMICDGRMFSRTRRMTARPASSAAAALPRFRAGTPFSPAGEMPRNSSAIDIVLAVNWPPHAPAPGTATLSISCRSSALICFAL